MINNRPMIQGVYPLWSTEIDSLPISGIALYNRRRCLFKRDYSAEGKTSYSLYLLTAEEIKTQNKLHKFNCQYLGNENDYRIPRPSRTSSRTKVKTYSNRNLKAPLTDAVNLIGWFEPEVFSDMWDVQDEYSILNLNKGITYLNTDWIGTSFLGKVYNKYYLLTREGETQKEFSLLVRKGRFTIDGEFKLIEESQLPWMRNPMFY